MPAEQKLATPWSAMTAARNPSPGMKKIRQKHKVMMSLHMAGWSDVEIAREMGYTPGRVGFILKSQHPEMLAHREGVADQVAKNIGDLILSFRAESRKSLTTLVEIRDKTDAPLSERRLSALAILDRAGYSPVKKQMNLDAQVPFQELQGIMGRLDKANEVVIARDKWVVQDVAK